MLSTILPIMIFFLSLKRCVCGITIFLPISEKTLLIYGVVPIILISSYSTGDLLPWSLIFLEYYGALLNDMFVVVVLVRHP